MLAIELASHLFSTFDINDLKPSNMSTEIGSQVAQIRGKGKLFLKVSQRHLLAVQLLFLQVVR